MFPEDKAPNCENPIRKQPGWLKNLSFYLTEYCSNTSIHGLKFLGERDRSPIEKIWWLIFLTISLYFCVTLNMNIYYKWMNSPVIVTFATTQTPIWKIPFPSVTICPEVKAKRSVYNFTQQYLLKQNNSLTEDQRRKFEHISLVCPTLFGMDPDENATLFADESALDFLLEVSPDFDDVIFGSHWLGQDIDEGVFKPVITSEGICYVFNLLNRDELFTDVMDHYKNFGLMDQDPSQWTLEKGYAKEADLETYPRRTMLAGVKGGLDLLLYTQTEDIDWLCGEALQGYKIILQHPAQLPSTHLPYFRVPLDQDVVAAIKPNMMTTAEELVYYRPEDRQCYFVHEKHLRFFKLYNQQNCLLECLSNFTYDQCGCVEFHMPRDNSTPICGSARSECVNSANAAFLVKEVSHKLKTVGTKKKKFRRKPSDDLHNTDCNCLPSCSSLEFDIETSQSDWEWRTPLSVLNMTDAAEDHISRVRIFFKDMQFITSERNQLYGQTDFWANCGGLLGLFTGFSFISTVEILYFATLRFICNLRKFGRHYWSGAQELIETKDQNEKMKF